MRQRRDGLQPQIRKLLCLFVLVTGEYAALTGESNRGLLNADFFGFGDDDVKAIAQRDRSVLVAVPSEGELEAGRECS